MRRRLAAGFTLLELLVVIAIVAVILGVGAGLISRLGHKNALEANHQAVRALLRRAHNASREERYGAVVEIDRGAAELRAQIKSSITQFRMETKTDLPPELGTPVMGQSEADETPPPFETPGAKGYSLVVDGGEQAIGRYGLGTLFEVSGPYGAAWAWAEDRPALSPLEGVYLEAWVKVGDLSTRLFDRPPAEPSLDQEELYLRGGEAPRTAPPRVKAFDRDDPPVFYVARKGRAFALAITAAYEVEVALTGPEDPERTWISRTRPGTVKPHKWTRLALAFDGRRIQVFVNGIPRVHLRARGLDDTSLFESLDGAGAAEVTLASGEKLGGELVLDAAELASAGTIGELLLAGADRGGIGDGDGVVTRDEFLERVPPRLIRDTAPLVVSDPDPRQSFYGVIDEVRLAAVIRSQRLAIPREVMLIAPEPSISFDLLGQLDPARHAEPFVIYMTDDDRVYEVLEPGDGGGAGGGTVTRTQQAEEAQRRAGLMLGRAPYERFVAALESGRIDPFKTRRLVVQRTGLVVGK